MVRFTIIVTHYQGSASDDILKRCMDSIESQDYDDYEVLLYHDGELIEESAYEEQIIIRPRSNDWGHSHRDTGIMHAKGEYIIHTNSDNVFYPGVFKELDSVIEKDNPTIIIMPIKMMGLVYDYSKKIIYYNKNRDYSKYVLFKGYPKYGAIDCMQLVMKTSVWMQEGGWHDKRVDGDGYMYPYFMEKYGFVRLGMVCGEHY